MFVLPAGHFSSVSLRVEGNTRAGGPADPRRNRGPITGLPLGVFRRRGPEPAVPIGQRPSVWCLGRVDIGGRYTDGLLTLRKPTETTTAQCPARRANISRL